MRLRAATVLLLLPALLGACEGCELLTGPEFQIKRALRLRSEVPLVEAGTELNLRFAASAIVIEGQKATAYTRVDVDGTLRGVTTRCLCVEPISLERQAEGWEISGFPLPRLDALVRTLEARREALEAGNLDAYLGLVHVAYAEDGTDREALARRLSGILSEGGRPRQEIVERVIRVDRERATVTETYRLEATVDGASVRHEGRARYTLETQHGQWRFTSGLL